MFLYTYSLVNDFPSGIQLDQLHAAVEAALVSFVGIKLSEDVVTFLFTAEQLDLTPLNALVAAHVPVEEAPSTLLVSLTPRTNVYKNDFFTRVASFAYPGTSKSAVLRQVDLVSYKDASVTSYTVRLLNTALATPTVVATQTFANAQEATMTLSIDAGDLPANMATLELQVKRNGGTTTSRVYVDSINVFA